MTSLASNWMSPKAHHQAMLDWCHHRGQQWIYIAKLLLAMTMAYWCSMFLELPSTRSAALTVLIVMQPTAGHVFAKSAARILGTILGLTATLTLVGLFHQQPVMFMLGTALWGGLCIFGAIRYRDLRAYVCLLSGYTVGMIGVPGAIDPSVLTPMAIGRMLAVIMGIVCGGLVSALVFPGTTVPAFKSMLANRFHQLCGHASGILRGNITPQEHEKARCQFAAQAVSIDALRKAASTENPEISSHRTRLLELNRHFMRLGTRLDALTRYYMALDENDPLDQHLKGAMQEMMQPLLQQLDELTEHQLSSKVMSSHLKSQELTSFATRMAIRENRKRLQENPWVQTLPEEVQDRLQERFDTLAELLFRFTDQMRLYCEQYASLTNEHLQQEIDEVAEFTTAVNPIHAITCGLRSAAVILIIALAWIESGWSGGTMMIQNGIIAAVLTATASNPHKMAVSLAIGAALGFTIGFVISMMVLPHVDGFPLMMASIFPIFIIGGFMTLIPRWAGIGLGAMINFCFVASPTNPATFLPEQFANNAIAGLLGMSSAAALLALMFPPSGRWLSNILIRDLRRLVASAVTAPLDQLEPRIDSQCRDLLNQTYNYTQGQVQVQRKLLDWHASVQAVCHALIELRQLLNYLDLFSPEEKNSHWRWQINMLGPSLIRLYLRPSRRHYDRAMNTTIKAIRETRPLLEPEETQFEESPKRQALSYLHFIYAALTDEDGPFRPYMAHIADKDPENENTSALEMSGS